MNAKVKKAIKNSTEKYWRMVDAIATIVHNNDGNYETNPIPEISSLRFRRYYRASVQFDKSARDLGLSFEYYDSVLDVVGAYDWLTKAKDQGWSVDEFKYQLKSAGAKATPVSYLRSNLRFVEKVRFENMNKRNYVNIVQNAETGAPCIRIGSTVLTRPNVYELHKRMGNCK